MARQKPRTKEMRFLSAVQLNCVLAQNLSLRDRALLSFLMESGARASEAIIRWRDVHPETMRVSVSGKTGSQDVPVTPGRSGSCRRCGPPMQGPTITCSCRRGETAP